MSKEILISVTPPQETRVAVAERGALQEINIEITRRGLSVVGHIDKGRVLRVLPGMQAAFIDIGLERDGYLHLSDIATEVDYAISAVSS